MCCSMSNCAGNRAGPRGVYSSLSSVCMRLMFGGSYGSCAQVFMQTLPVGRTGAARPAAGGPTCSSPRVRRRVLAAAGRWCPRWANWRAAGVKHGVAAAALAPAACCSDDRVAPIRASRPTETALTGLRPRIGMGAGAGAIHEPRRLSRPPGRSRTSRTPHGTTPKRTRARGAWRTSMATAWCTTSASARTATTCPGELPQLAAKWHGAMGACRWSWVLGRRCGCTGNTRRRPTVRLPASGARRPRTRVRRARATPALWH